MADTEFEIPQNLRDLAEQNMKEVHAAHEQFTDLVTKAMDVWKSAMRAGLAAARSKDVQDRMKEIAKKNAESASALAEMIAKAQKFPAASDNEKPPRRKSAKSKTATSGTSTTPPLPSPAPPNPRRRPRTKPKAAKKEAAARGKALLKDK
jgi:hypothetical protein